MKEKTDNNKKQKKIIKLAKNFINRKSYKKNDNKFSNILKDSDLLLRDNFKHSFLLWLLLPVFFAWMSIGYVNGFFMDKPFWNDKNTQQKYKNNIVPYYQTHGSFSVNLDEPLVTFWFDDAWSSQFDIAFQILKKFNFAGTIAVPVDPIESSGYMNWGQLRVMQENNWEITSHSMSHNCEMQTWDVKKIRAEYLNSKLILWKNGLSSDIFVTPCGVDSKIMQEEAMKTFLGYRTVDPGMNDPKNMDFYHFKVRNIDNSTTLIDMKKWVDAAINEKKWVILVFHKIGEGSGVVSEDIYNTPRKDFEDIVKYIKSKEINVVTPMTVLASRLYEN